MRLRNKKTGGIVDFIAINLTSENKIEFCLVAPNGDERCWEYNSLAEFNEEWEDYKTAEPLIKNQRIRAAVRAWLAIQEQPIVACAITCNKDSDGFFNYCLYGYIEKARISNGKPIVNNNLTAIDFEFRNLEKINFVRSHDYTIAELCGEEEE